MPSVTKPKEVSLCVRLNTRTAGPNISILLLVQNLSINQIQVAWRLSTENPILVEVHVYIIPFRSQAGGN